MKSFCRRTHGGLALLLLALLPAIALAQQKPFSAAPHAPLHDYDLNKGQDVQRFNGDFVERLIRQTMTPAGKDCLHKVAVSPVIVDTYDSGAIRVREGSCENVLNPIGAPLGTETSEVSLRANRILAAALANERFNSDLRFARNDRNLSHYDIDFFDKNGDVYVTFFPRIKTNLLFAGCPPIGPIAATFIIDPATFALALGRSAC